MIYDKFRRLRIVQVVLRQTPSALACSSSVTNPAVASASLRRGCQRTVIWRWAFEKALAPAIQIVPIALGIFAVGLFFGLKIVRKRLDGPCGDSNESGAIIIAATLADSFNFPFGSFEVCNCAENAFRLQNAPIRRFVSTSNRKRLMQQEERTITNCYSIAFDDAVCTFL
ncbi:MAG: hypothetical protein ACM3Z4_04860, partial [Hyphomicrobiales bacterium]